MNKYNLEKIEILAFNFYGMATMINLQIKMEPKSFSSMQEKEKQMKDLQTEYFKAERELQDFFAQCGGKIFEPNQPNYIPPK